MGSPISIYSTPAETLYEGPFWDLLHTVAKQSAESTLVIVSSYKLKEVIEEKLANDLNDDGLIPTCLTLDELIQKQLGTPLADNPTLDKALCEKALKTYLPRSHRLSKTDLTAGFKDRLFDTLLNTHTYDFDPQKCPGNPWTTTFKHLKETFKAVCQSTHISRKPEAYHTVSTSDVFKNSLRNTGCFVIGFWQCPAYQRPLLETVLTHADASAILLPYEPHNTVYSGTNSFKEFLMALPNARDIHTPSDKKAPAPTYIQASSAEEECHWICQDILQKKQAQPALNWQDFTLITASLSLYTPILNRLLTAYNIPCKTPLKQPFFHHPLYRLIDALFQWLDTPDTHQFIRLLSTTCLTEMTDDTGQDSLPINPRLFQILEESQGTKTQLEDLKNGCFIHIDRLKKSQSDPNTDMANAAIDIDLAKSQLTLIDRFITIRNNGRAAKTPEDCVLWIQAFLKQIQLDPQDTAVKLVCETAIKTSHLFDFLYPEASAAMFRKFLKKELTQTAHTLRAVDPDGIQIIGKFESFSYPLNQAYCLDCTAGTWPKTSTAPLFFSDTDLDILEWPNQKTYKAWDELLFFCALKQAKNMTLTAPHNRGSTPTIPSPFISRLKQDHLGILHTQTATLSSELLTQKTYLKNFGEMSKEPLPPQIPLNAPHATLWPALETRCVEPFTYPFSLTGAPHLHNDIENHILTTKFSPTRFEAYQKCPTAYYFQYFLGERPIQALESDISQAIWGQFLHKLLQDIGEKMHQKNMFFHQPANHAAITELALELTEQAINQQSQNRFFWEQKRPFLIGTPQKQGLISAWLHCEFNDQTPLIPTHFEETLFSQLSHPELGTIHLKGTIDVVLGSPHNNWLAVQDYKTGKTPPKAIDIATFYHLQLPIYQWLLQKKYPTKTVAGSFVVRLHSPHEVEKKCLSTTPDAKENLLALGKKRPCILPDDYNTQLQQHLLSIIELIKTGHFGPQPPSPLNQYQSKRKDVCRYCPYWGTCHYEKRFQK